MPERSRLADGFGFRFALLFLAFSVFAWGLQAKLSLYKAAPFPSTATVAKLSSENRSAQTIASLQSTMKSNIDRGTIKFLCFLDSLRAAEGPSVRFQQVEVRLCRSCGSEWQNLDVMRRPPPALS